MKKPITAFLLICTFATTLLVAQTPTPSPTPTPGRGRPNAAQMIERRVQRLTTLLNLTSDQQQQAINFFTTAANTSGPLMTQMRTLRQTLRTAIQNNDLNTITQTATQIGTLMGQLTAARSTAEAQFYNILTPDQREKLGALRGRGRGMGGIGFGPGGGPMGFDGPGASGGPGQGPHHGGR
ncbi:MAG: Spy/CpxP family protein refolding chaperone [Acidobacteria bacterium]|nr:Spy/CpxP family protein refolding chaperone [Acidobacteriota bacterium]